MNDVAIPIRHKKWDLEVSAQIRNAGPNWVVCLHGLQSRKELFTSVFQRLAPTDFSLLTIDFIGFGHSPKPKDFSYSLEEQAAIVEQVLEHMHVKNLFLIGHSMGGMIGTMLLKNLDERLLGFINMEGNFVLQDCGESLPVSQLSFKDFSVSYYPKLKASLVSSEEPSAAFRNESLNLTPDYAFHRTSQSIVEWSRNEELIPLFVESKAKKLYMYGAKNSRKASELPTSISKAEVPSAGHFMFADNQRSTLQIIDNFISK